MKSAQQQLDEMRELAASMERHGAALQAELILLRARPATGDWILRGKHINEFQQASIARMVRRCKQAHFTNLDIRINGKNEAEEADWVKWLEPLYAEPVRKAGDHTVADCIRLADKLRPGFVMVPEEPTQEMMAAGAAHTGGLSTTAGAVWDNMLAARPKP